jgi:hypothetical protein
MKSYDMPLEYDEMLKYTPEFYVRTEPEQLYGKWLVAHEVPMEEIVSQMSHTFRCKQHQVYVRYLQYENVVDAGLFIYSHWNMNGDRLTELLSNMSGYHMSGRWKAIASGRKWTPPSTKGEEESPLPYRALHIECTRSEKEKVVAFLEALYKTSFKREYPMGVKLLFIGSIRDATGFAETAV